MQRAAVVLLALGCVLAGAVLHALIAPPPSPAVKLAEVNLAEVGPGEVGRADEATHRRLERVEARLEEVVEGLAMLRDRPASARPPAAVAPSAARGPQLRGSAPAGSASASAAEAPRESFEGRGNEALANEARALARGKKDLPGALRRWRALLARNLPAEERHHALLGLGMALRDQDESDKAVETFRQVIDEAAPNSTDEFVGRLQLGSTLFWAADYRGALQEAETVATSRHAQPWQVVGARWNVVTAMIKLGDEAGARRELESMIEDYTGKEGMEALLRQYQAQLAKLE